MIRKDIIYTFITFMLILLLASSASSQTNLRRILTIEGPGYEDMLGYTLIALGDINGDGWPDLGISDEDDGHAKYPRFIFRVYFGGRGILDQKPEYGLLGGDNAVSGDFNNDEYMDIAVLWRNSSNLPDVDTVFIYLGNSSSGNRIDTIPALRIAGTFGGSDFGSVMAVGDLNDDGVDDLVISEPSNAAGKVYIFLGKTPFSAIPDFVSGMPGTIPPKKWPSDQAFGTSLDIADMNGDGIDDLLVSSAHRQVNEGVWETLFIYHGGSNWSFVAEKPDQKFEGRNFPFLESIAWGWNLRSCSVHDMNGDGMSDIIVGNGSSEASMQQVFVFQGGRDSVDYISDQTLSNPDSVYFHGVRQYRMIRDASDLNADGYRDVSLNVVKGYSCNLVFLPGSPKGVLPTPFAKVLGGREDYGDRTATPGDINGDGVDDFCVAGWGSWGTQAQGIVDILAGDSTLKVLSTEQLQLAPTDMELGMGFPNPFSGEIAFDVTLASPAYVAVRVHDLIGREIAMPFAGMLERGARRIAWDGRNAEGGSAPEGVYIVTASNGKQLLARKVTLQHRAGNAH
jgi:hypothetical protein